MKKIIILSIMILFFVVEINAQNKSYQGIRASYASLWSIGWELITIDSNDYFGQKININPNGYIRQEINLGTYRGYKFSASYRKFYPELINQNVGLNLGLGVGYHNIGAVFANYHKKGGNINEWDRPVQNFIFLQGDASLDWKILGEFRISLGTDVICFKKPYNPLFDMPNDTLALHNELEPQQKMGLDYIETFHLDAPFGLFYLPHLGMSYMFNLGADYKLVPELKVQFMRETWDSGPLKGMTKFRQLNTVFGLSLLF